MICVTDSVHFRGGTSGYFSLKRWLDERCWSWWPLIWTVLLGDSEIAPDEHERLADNDGACQRESRQLCEAQETKHLDTNGK